MWDLPWRKYQTVVVVEFYRLRWPKCGLKVEGPSAAAAEIRIFVTLLLKAQRLTTLKAEFLVLRKAA